MATNNQTDYKSELINNILNVTSKIRICSNIQELKEDVKNILYKILCCEYQEEYSNPTYTTFIYLLESTNLSENIEIRTLIQKIKTDIIVLSFLDSYQNEYQINTNTTTTNLVLSKGEQEYFYIENGNMKLKDSIDVGNRRRLVFYESDDNGEKIRKEYELDLNTRYVISKNIKNSELLHPYSSEYNSDFNKRDFERLKNAILNNEKKVSEEEL